MRKIEMLNKLQAEMKEARTTVEQLCADWGWTLSDKETTIVNNITINKGKVVEITKEDTATIEMLRETIRQMNETMNDMNKEIEELERENHVQKGMIAGYEAQLQNKQMTIEELEKQIADAKEDKVRAEIIRRKDGSTVEVVDDPLYNTPEEKPVVKETQPKIEVDITLYDLHKTHDGCYRGYTKDYEFVWNVNSNVPAMKLAKGKKWMPMTKGYYKDALYIKQVINDTFLKDNSVTEPQEEVVVEEQDTFTVVSITKEPEVMKPGMTKTVKASDIFGSEDTNDDPLGNTDELEFF